MPLARGSGAIIIPTEVFEPKVRMTITADDDTVYTIVNTSPTEYMPVGHWKLDGNSRDCSENVLDGTDTDIDYVSGKYNQCAYFDGSSSEITITNDAVLNTPSFSVSIWFNTDTIRTQGIINKGWTGSVSDGWRLFMHTTSGTIEFDGSGEIGNIQTGATTEDTWYHVVATYSDDDNRMRIYLDGVLKSTATSVTIDNSNTDDIGLGTPAISYLDGMLDDVKYFNYELTQDEITAIYNRDAATEDFYTDYMLTGSVTKPVRDSIGRMSFKIANPLGHFTDKFNGGEIIKLWFDYADASTLYFRGKIDNPKAGLSNNEGFYLDISGRDYPELADKTLVASFISANIVDAIKLVLSENYSNITFTYWEDGDWTETPSALTTTISAEYQNQKGISVLSDLCKRGELECYLEYSGGWKLRVFAKGSKTNTTETIAYGTNLLGLTDFGKDNLSVKNRAIVYGKSESDNILLLRSKNDAASQSNLWIKDEILTDGSISTNTSCSEKASSVLTQKSTVNTTGRINSIGLYSVTPGENLFISIPYLNINTNFRVQELTTNFGSGITSSLNISENIPTLVDVFKRHDDTEELVTAYENLNGMTNSFVIWFDEAPSEMTLVGCEETEGRLQLETGQTTGIATVTTSQSADIDITECEFRRYENYSTTTDVLQVSNDNGTTWETIDKNVGVHVFTSTGRLLKFKITMNRSTTSDPTPAYESVAILYK